MSRIAELRKPFLGHWRIVSADQFDREHLDLCGEARLIVPREGSGEVSFGALAAGLEFSFAPGMMFFDFQGHDEMDEVTGEGRMELTGLDNAEIELEYHHGDIYVLQAERVDREEAIV
jgi:hypothetical protein